MSLSHRMSSASDASTSTGSSTTSPSARRVSVGRWRDPRLWLGLALVCGSVLIGAKLLAAADDTVTVWQVDRAASAGMAIGADDLGTARVHFEDEDAADLYWPIARGIPDDARLRRDVAEGELLSSAAITTGDVSALRRMPLRVPSGGFPAGLSVGDHVDVWAMPAEGKVARQVLADVTVVDLGAGGSAGIAGDRDVAVSLPSDADVADALGSLNEASVVLIMLGG